ncbi:metal ABC transporter ATP-binding protein [Microbacterium trichothecenolyticum]|uniref:Zinc/manganese transport system ATP-binding protein n=1 Tax=Microbacterium trichothecenolyticum TaxID=69370 RepID=A0ABU0TRN0_MICTR|nr:metal ABC transporter ATP-binding protein [Microbacterium trichothecenolyticum]MDQ1122328.1 zinc/manganese transport system ATP-binding protein [Microbacterium trichothecenolyticum]
MNPGLPHPDSAAVVLMARGVGVRLGGATVLDDVDLDVPAGSIVGLIGSNGAGKTTLLRVLLGILRPHVGYVQRPDRRAGIGYVPQKISLDPHAPLRARDVVMLGLDGARLGVPLRRRRLRAAVDEALDAVGATAFADARVGELSGGQQQRVLLAHAIVSRPALLLLDEPLASLDPVSARDVVVLLDALRERTGVAIVVTAHDLTLLLPVLDRVAYLAEGRAAVGTPAEVVRDDVLSALYRRPMRVIEAAGRTFVIADDDGPAR